MNSYNRRSFGTESNAGAGMADRPANAVEEEAVKKVAQFPGTEAEAAGMKPESNDEASGKGQQVDTQHQS